MRRPWRKRDISSLSSEIGSRWRRSSTEISRIWAISTFPEIRAFMRGMIFVLIEASAQASRMPRKLSAVLSDSTMIACSISYLSTICDIFSILPNTGTPAMTRPASSGDSLMIPTRSKGDCASLRNDSAICLASLPDPMRMARAPIAWKLKRFAFSKIMRRKTRTPTQSATTRTQLMKSTPTGMRNHCAVSTSSI